MQENLAQNTAHYLNREISWLRFDKRVLQEAQTADNPLLERLRFLSIATSNLDEFFMVRVGGLLDKQGLAPHQQDNKTGMSACAQIDAIHQEVAQLYPQFTKTYQDIARQLAGHHIQQLDLCHADFQTVAFARQYFETEVLPILSAQMIKGKQPFPHLENKRIYLAADLVGKGKLAHMLVSIPAILPRYVVMPGEGLQFISIHHLIYFFLELLFPGKELTGKAVIRVTRNADVTIDESQDDVDFKDIMLTAIKERNRLAPVRLEYFDNADQGVIDYYLGKLGLSAEKSYAVYQNFTYSFHEIIESKLTPELKQILTYPPHLPKWPKTLHQGAIMPQVLERDLFLSYPYDSMKPFVELLREASMDPEVVSIKITLYRVSAQSQIAEYLTSAAENGKEVTAVVELRARFDEANNINWSDRLYQSGVAVVYGLEDMKIHSKILLITKKTAQGVQYITHIGTGNYNEKTARFYTDLNIITCDPEIGQDGVQFFRDILASNPYGSYRHLLVAPNTLKPGLLGLIAEQQELAEQGKVCAITCKMNGLSDKDIIDALIRASCAGVPIRLIVRGICCLRPGVPGVSDNIEVISIVGRFLEHPRVYVFGVGDARRVYIASADWMTRNTEHRIEIAAPIRNPMIAAYICRYLEVQLSDNVKAHRLLSSGEYECVRDGNDRLNAQEYFIQEDGHFGAAAPPPAPTAPGAPSGGLLGKLKNIFSPPDHS